MSSSDADTGRDLIINYSLEWNEITDPTNDIWTVLILAPEAQSQFTVMQNSTPGYKINSRYQVRIAAINSVGLGHYSDPLELLTDNHPVRMNTPVEDPATNATQILVTWEPIVDESDTGRDPVFYYKLEWDQGTDTWSELNTNETLITSFLLNEETGFMI